MAFPFPPTLLKTGVGASVVQLTENAHYWIIILPSLRVLPLLRTVGSAPNAILRWALGKTRW